MSDIIKTTVWALVLVWITAISVPLGAALVLWFFVALIYLENT